MYKLRYYFRINILSHSIVLNYKKDLLIMLIAKNFSITSISVIPLTLVLNLFPLEITVRHSCKWGQVSKNILPASRHL